VPLDRSPTIPPLRKPSPGGEKSERRVRLVAAATKPLDETAASTHQQPLGPAHRATGGLLLSVLGRAKRQRPPHCRVGEIAEVSRRPVASEVFASSRPWPGHASRSVKSSTALRRRSPGTGIAPPSAPEMSALASSALAAQLLARSTVLNEWRHPMGPGADDSGGAGQKGWPPRSPRPRGDQCAPRGRAARG
jgi:hypothetical protein